MRNVSKRQISTISGTTTRVETMMLRRRPGMIDRRKLIVSLSMIMTSRKFAVIQMMSNLSRETRTRMTIISSDSAAATAGRRVTTSQKKFRMPQASRKASLATKSASVNAMMVNEVRCSDATSTIRHASPRPTARDAPRRCTKDETAGGMANAAVPGNDHALEIRHTSQLS